LVLRSAEQADAVRSVELHSREAVDVIGLQAAGLAASASIPDDSSLLLAVCAA
jgi:hypothetical protein